MASEINFNGAIQFTSGFPLGDHNRSDCQPNVSYLEKDVKYDHLKGFGQFSKLGSSINPFARLGTSACGGFKQPEPPCEGFYRPAPPCASLTLFPDLDPNILSKVPLMNNDEFIDNFVNVDISSQVQSMPIDDRQSNDRTQGKSFAVDPEKLPIRKRPVSQRNLNIAQQEPTRKVINNQIIKGRWFAAEDRILTKLVTKYGDKDWAFIAKHLKGRVGKQCRERWNYHLNPNIKKADWSVDEDEMIVEGHKRMGSKWAEIARLMPGRTDSAIKNRWNATLRKYMNSKSSVSGSSRSFYDWSSMPLVSYIATIQETSELKYESADDDADA